MLAGTVVGQPQPEDGPRPLQRAHSHNDYEQARPLALALEHGFCSVEADIHLVDGQLLVAHDRASVSPERTLVSLYLDPIQSRIRTNGGHVHRATPGGAAGPLARAAGREHEFILLIDIKSPAEPTYKVLRECLGRYSAMLTRFGDGRIEPGPVTVILSGNRPTAMVRGESWRWCAIDGRGPDLDGNPPVSLMPMISDSWASRFGGFRDGQLPGLEREKLRRVIDQGHRQGRMMRFWGVPDEAFAWRELRDAGVDWIGTDKVAQLAAFLRMP